METNFLSQLDEELRKYTFSAIRLLKNYSIPITKQDKEDIIQEAYIAFLEAKKEGKNWKNYVSRAIRKFCYHFIRKKKGMISLEKLSEEGIDQRIISSKDLELEQVIDTFENEKEFITRVNKLKEIIQRKYKLKKISKERIEFILRFTSPKFILSLSIPDSNFSNIKNKLSYLRFFKDNLLKTDEKEYAKIYTEILLGIRKKFPPNFLDENYKFLIRYLFKTILDKDPSEVRDTYSNIYRKYKLITIADKITIKKSIRDAFPEKGEWEFNISYWTEKDLYDAFLSIAKQKEVPIHNLKRKDIPPKLEWAIIKKFKSFSSFLKNLPVPLEEKIKAPIVNKFKNKDSDKIIKKSIEILINNLTKDFNVTIEDIPSIFYNLNINEKRKIISKYGFYGLLKKFKNSPYKLFDYYLPGYFQPWEFGKKSLFHYLKKGETKEERARKATKWFVEKKLNLNSPEEIMKYTKKEIKEKLREYGLSQLYYFYNKNVYRIFKEAYPRIFKSDVFKTSRKQKNLNKNSIIKK